MAFKMNVRTQETFLPTMIDDYVGPQDPVRVYDAFVNALNFPELGISLIPQAGAESYEPRQMLKLIIYGYSYGVRSSRQLERACHHNLSFIWLTGGLKPDYRTIARFRVDHKDAIKKVLKQCVRMCVEMDLVDGNTLFFDGSKFRANASIGKTLSREHLEQELQKVEAHIHELVEENERADQGDDGESSYVKSKKELRNQESLAGRLKECLAKIAERDCPSANTTDPDCTTAKSRQGTHAEHNVQVGTDGKHGMIVSADAVGEPNDNNQLPPQIKNSTENVGHKPLTACTDSGYFNPPAMKDIDEQITVVMPSPQQAHAERAKEETPPEPFDKKHFQYDKEHDEYVCPDGKRLTHKGTDSDRPHRHIYQAKASECRACPHWGSCTTAKNGRKVVRSEYEEIIKRQEEVYKSDQGQAVYKLRKQHAEHPFGHLKRNLGAGQLLLRGREKVNAEVSILATCFNLARMITIMGFTQLIAHFRGA